MNTTNSRPTSEPRFFGDRLRIARNFRGLTLADVGKLVGLSHAAIHHFETGLRTPDELTRAALGEALGFSSAYFERPVSDEFREEECHFRSGRMTASLRARILSHGTLFGQLVALLGSHVKLPKVNLPETLSSGTEVVEKNAESVRRRFGLGLDRPITSMMRLLENHGVVVTRFEASTPFSDAMSVDAFSRSAGTRPIVVLNTDKGSASRTRWDLAHEFGHLVMHGGLPPGDSGRESEADGFAAALLLPKVGFMREFLVAGNLDWALVFEMKKRWKVSAAAVLRRGFDVGRLSALEYRRAMKHYMYKGWHRGEPEEPVDEPPELVGIATSVCQQSRGIAPADLARTLGWRPSTFETVAGIAATEIENGRQGKDARIFHIGSRR